MINAKKFLDDPAASNFGYGMDREQYVNYRRTNV